MSTCQNKGDYLFVEVSEAYSLDILMSTIHEVAEHCRKENLNKALIDLRQMEGSPNIFDRYRIGIEIAKAWGAKIKVAVIAKPGVVNRMAENTAVNRGAKLMTVFDEETALTWLEIESHKEKPREKLHD
jgi:hypothetical protein